MVLAALTYFALPSWAAASDLTIYSSLPRQGVGRAQTEAVIAGARRALSDAGFQAGGKSIRYVSQDSSYASTGTWTPEATARNARRAARDPSTIAYVGEFNSAASAISIPILNKAGILQISPSNTSLGLTSGGAGATAGEPAKYYPTGNRTYGRVIPNDLVQGRAAAALLQTLGKRRVLVVHDGEQYGRAVARFTKDALLARGIEIVGVRALTGSARNARLIARAASAADGLFYGGVTGSNPHELWRRLASRNDLVKVASDGVAERAFFDTRRGGVSARAARNTYIISTLLPPAAYPSAGQQLLRSMGNPDGYAIYGYEAMALVLDSINRGGPTRADAVTAFFDTRARDSVLGPYSIDANGDTTLTRIGVYRIKSRRMKFDRVVDGGAVAPAPATPEQATVLAPAEGSLSSSPQTPPHHTPFGGNWAADVAGAVGRPVYARFSNASGTVGLTVLETFEPCGSPYGGTAGVGVKVQVSVDGVTLGVVNYLHLADMHPVGVIANGAQIGTMSAGTTAANPDEGCWTGPHVHVEPRNTSGYSCFQATPLNSPVGASSRLGVIGGASANGPNQLCPATRASS